MQDQEPNSKPKHVLSLLFKTFTWLLAAGCFFWVYTKIAGAAAKEDLSSWRYLLNFFGEANWLIWLSVMIPYSVFFFLVDSNVTWRVLRWFNAPDLKYGSVLPIRASTYILSLVNEQVGKGAMSLYLLKTYQVPGWKALSSMIFIGICEIYHLLLFSSVGLVVFFGYVQQASTALPLDVILPAVFILAFVYFPFHIAFFRGYIFKESKIRNISALHALREAKFLNYVLTILLKSPNMIGAVFVYTIALAVFNVEANTGQMLVFLPLIFLAAALPLPFHAGALVIWTVVFPDYPAIGAFSLVMHTFFVVFNALIGVCFLPRANRELFDQ